jgi:hypothetical protein
VKKTKEKIFENVIKLFHPSKERESTKKEKHTTQLQIDIARGFTFTFPGLTGRVSIPVLEGKKYVFKSFTLHGPMGEIQWKEQQDAEKYANDIGRYMAYCACQRKSPEDLVDLKEYTAYQNLLNEAFSLSLAELQKHEKYKDLIFLEKILGVTQGHLSAFLSVANKQFKIKTGKKTVEKIETGMQNLYKGSLSFDSNGRVRLLSSQLFYLISNESHEKFFYRDPSGEIRILDFEENMDKIRDFRSSMSRLDDPKDRKEEVEQNKGGDETEKEYVFGFRKLDSLGMIQIPMKTETMNLRPLLNIYGAVDYMAGDQPYEYFMHLQTYSKNIEGPSAARLKTSWKDKLRPSFTPSKLSTLTVPSRKSSTLSASSSPSTPSSGDSADSRTPSPFPTSSRTPSPLPTSEDDDKLGAEEIIISNLEMSAQLDEIINTAKEEPTYSEALGDLLVDLKNLHNSLKDYLLLVQYRDNPRLLKERLSRIIEELNASIKTKPVDLKSIQARRDNLKYVSENIEKHINIDLLLAEGETISSGYKKLMEVVKRKLEQGTKKRESPR